MKHTFLDKYSNLESPIHRLDARVKIICFLAIVTICVSTPPTSFSAFGIYFAIVLMVIGLSNLPLKHIFFRSLIIIPFVVFVAIFIPFLKQDTIGGGYNLGIGGLNVSRSGLLVFWNVLVKSLIGILCVIILSSTTPFPKILQTLERLRIPNIIIMLLSFTYRYIFVFVDEAIRMKRARDSRLFRGRWIWQAYVTGRMIATLFLRSYERGERVYIAMVSRGFNGRFPSQEKTRMKVLDVIFALFILSAVVSTRMFIK